MLFMMVTHHFQAVKLQDAFSHSQWMGLHKQHNESLASTWVINKGVYASMKHTTQIVSFASFSAHF